MMDLLDKKDNKIACSLDVKGGVDREKIAAGIKIIATNPRVEGIVINILGGFVRCDLIADGIIDAATEVGMNIPIVVRFEGTNRDEAKNILEKAKLPLLLAETIEDAVNKIVKSVQESD
jgi:succinyl-CoA synthetase beta subunit